jgi:hypothetical protein
LNHWLLGLGAVVLTSCGYFRKDSAQGGDWAAKVGQAVLTKAEVVALIPEPMTGDDSAAYYRNYVQTWARQQVVLSQAEYNLGNDQKNFEAQIKQYRDDLLRFTYQEELINKYLDTTVTAAQIAEYYNRYPESFQLKENIVRANYMVLPTGAPKQEEGRSLFFSSKPTDRAKLTTYALQYAWRYSLEDTIWMPFQDLRMIVPVQAYNEQQFLQENRQIVLRDSNKVYFCHLLEYKIKESAPPMNYVKSNIRSVILNKRRLELWSDLEMSIFKEALDEGTLEIYE